jgi:N-acyl-D-aspartate/D-glutamate deacylase
LTCNEKGHKVKPENPDAESTFPSYTFGDLVVDELYNSKGDFALAYHAVSEEELIHFLEQSWTMAGTDGIQGAFHPRTHGTFPRILGRYVREMKALSLEDAIRKITSLPADTFGFKGRGRILPNAIADIVVFDPDTVIDKSTLVSPNLYPEGIDYVLVNGELVVEKGERTEAFPGKAILRS